MKSPLTQQQREERYMNSPEHIKEMYAGESGGEALRAAFECYRIADELYPIYATIVGDVILGFYRRSDLPKLLMIELGVSETIAEKVSKELEPFLIKAGREQEIPKAEGALREKLELRPGGIEKTPKDDSESEKPLTREEVLQALSPKRTMQSDIASLRNSEDTER